MKRMNFPNRKTLRRQQAEARNLLTKPEDRKKARLARLKEQTDAKV